ncbi:MAG: tyrosine-type recombinase/integrase [Candidatus Cloacimonadales bacterium]
MKKLMKKEGKLKELVLFEIGIKTGLRISDILKLTWNDVYSEFGENPTFRQSIVITEKKTGKSKQFRLSDSVKESVNQLIGLDNPQKTTFIFISDSNSVTASKSAWTRQYVWQFLNDYGYRSGIKEKIGTHTMRKTFGYHAYKNGVDLSLLMRIFNHSSQTVTLRYIGITQDQIDDVYINLDKIL